MFSNSIINSPIFFTPDQQLQRFTDQTQLQLQITFSLFNQLKVTEFRCDQLQNELNAKQLHLQQLNDKLQPLIKALQQNHPFQPLMPQIQQIGFEAQRINFESYQLQQLSAKLESLIQTQTSFLQLLDQQQHVSQPGSQPSFQQLDLLEPEIARIFQELEQIKPHVHSILSEIGELFILHRESSPEQLKDKELSFLQSHEQELLKFKNSQFKVTTKVHFKELCNHKLLQPITQKNLQNQHIAKIKILQTQIQTHLNSQLLQQFETGKKQLYTLQSQKAFQDLHDLQIQQFETLQQLANIHNFLLQRNYNELEQEVAQILVNF